MSGLSRQVGRPDPARTCSALTCPLGALEEAVAILINHMQRLPHSFRTRRGALDLRLATSFLAALASCARGEARHDTATVVAAAPASDTALPPDTLVRMLEWAWVPGAANDSVGTFLRLVEDGRGRMFVRLEETVPGDVASLSGAGPEPSRVLTYMMLPPHDAADQVTLDGCRVIGGQGEREERSHLPDGKSDVIAFTESDDGSGRKLAVRRAWRASPAPPRISEIPVSTVECWSEDNGGV